MKKIVLSIIAIATFSTIASAQIKIYEEGSTTDVSGGEVAINAWQGTEVHTAFHIVNSTGAAHTWNVTRVKLNSIPSTWSDYLCWGPQGGFGNCYPASGMTTTSWTTPSADAPTIAVGDSALLSTYITPDFSANGNETYRYYVGTDQNPTMDSVDVRVFFTLGLNEVTPQLSINIAPNPSNDYFVVSAEGSEASSIKIVDVLGNVILSEQMNTASKKVEVSSFRNGVYFVIIESNTAKPVTKRIVVRH